MGIGRLRLALLVTFGFLALSGCISVDTSVTLRDDGSGTVGFVYTIDRAAWETGVFDDSDVARPVPVTKHEFETAALRIEGLRLRSYGQERDEETVTVRARLDFDSTEDLRSLLGASTLDVDLRAGTWRQVIAPGDGAAGPEAAALAESLAGYRLDFLLTPPEPVTQTNGETGDEARTSRFSVSLGAVATAQDEIVWEVRW